MSRPPLAVRLQGPGVDRHIEDELVGDLEFTSTMPGGFGPATWSMQRPLEDIPPELHPFTRVTVLDGRDGSVLNAGRLEVPGRGQPWRIATVGARGYASDVRKPYVVVDSRLSEWETSEGYGGVNMPTAQIATQGGAGEQPGLRMAFPRGMVVPVNGRVTVNYAHMLGSGQRLARLDATHWEGVAGVWWQQWQVLSAAGVGINTGHDVWSTSSQSLTALITTDFSSITPMAMVNWMATNGTGGTVGNDVTWSFTSLLRIQTVRYTQAGTEQLTAAPYGNSYVLPHEVVADLLGRPGRLPGFDGAGASVSTASTVQIKQLAYSDGGTPADVFDDLMALDAAMRWAAWEPNDAGLYRFVWDAWPSVVAWEVTADAGSFTSAGADAELVNALQVRWTDLRGRVQWSTYTHTAPLLDAAGLTRTDVVDLGSDVGSQGTADAAAARYFADHQYPANSGTLAVSAPVYDRVLGRMLQPWELRAGSLIRVRNLVPRLDSLNAAARDGSSVFRVTKVAYSARTNRATLTLDSYSDTLYGALVRTSKDQRKFVRRQ